MADNSAAPHSFRPLRFWDALMGDGRCKHCIVPRDAHPMHYWAPARSLRDKRRYPLTYETLSGEARTDV